jgi:7-cyano-7-deazaguanine synthase
VLFSGGLDSTACAHLLRTRGFDVMGLYIDFGQAAANAERGAVATLREKLSLKVSYLRLSGFGQQFAGELPGRNMLLISAANFFANGSSCVIGTGIHSGVPYYDCSEAFLAAANQLISAQSDGRVSVISPFAQWSKRDIYEYARAETLPVGDTYSCEQGSLPVCGICASCRDRKGLGC